jgi:hypothetical protein
VREPFGQVVACDPLLARALGIVGDDDNAVACDSHHLGKARGEITPMVECQDCHDRIERIVVKREMLGCGPNDRGATRRSLRDHHRRGLNGNDLAVARFIRACACSHVEDSPCISERPPDWLRESRVGLTDRPVTATNPVIGSLGGNPARLTALTLVAWNSDIGPAACRTRRACSRPGRTARSPCARPRLVCR